MTHSLPSFCQGYRFTADPTKARTDVPEVPLVRAGEDGRALHRAPQHAAERAAVLPGMMYGGYLCDNRQKSDNFEAEQAFFRCEMVLFT